MSDNSPTYGFCPMCGERMVIKRSSKIVCGASCRRKKKNEDKPYIEVKQNDFLQSIQALHSAIVDKQFPITESEWRELRTSQTMLAQILDLSVIQQEFDSMQSED